MTSFSLTITTLMKVAGDGCATSANLYYDGLGTAYKIGYDASLDPSDNEMLATLSDGENERYSLWGTDTAITV